jgi:hypothetical protein
LAAGAALGAATSDAAARRKSAERGIMGGKGFYIPDGRKFQPIFSGAPSSASVQLHH